MAPDTDGCTDGDASPTQGTTTTSTGGSSTANPESGSSSAVTSGVVTTADDTESGSSGSAGDEFATLLFASGFEGMTILGPAPAYDGGLQYFSGTDLTTGFAWSPSFPPLLPTDSLYLNNVTLQTPAPTVEYMENLIVQTPGPRGRPTNALSMRFKQDPPSTPVGQISLNLMYDDSAEPGPLYIRYWMRPSPEIYEALEPGAWQWHIISELKAGHGADFRFQVMVGTNGDPATLPFYFVQADHCTPRQCNSPVYWRYEIEMTERERAIWEGGAWIPVEIYLRRNPDDLADGRFFVAIDGRVIVDLSAADHTFWDEAATFQTFWILQSLYGLRGIDHAQAIDDLELWDGFPCAEPPCSENPETAGS